MTVDLTLGLAKFEQDSGKAAQVITRDSERMSRAARLVEQAIQKQQDTYGRTATEVLALQAAQAGLTGTAQRLVDVMQRGAGVTAAAGSGLAAGFASASGAAQSAADKQKALNLELVQSILQVNAAYEKQRAAVVARSDAGTATPEKTKFDLGALAAQRDAGVAALKVERDRQFASNEAAAVENANVAKRVAATEKLIASVQKLRFEQEQAAGGKAKAAAEADAAVAKRFDEERRQSIQSLLNKLNEVPEAYLRNKRLLEQGLKAGDLSPGQFQSASIRLNDTQNPEVLRAKAAAAEVNRLANERIALAQRTAAAEAASTQQFIDALQRQSDAIGKTRSQLLSEEAARRGVTAQAAPFIAKMAEMDAKTGQFGKSAFASRNQLLTLQYTISDVIASAGSGISPLTILLQQGGQVFDAFGGAAAQGKGGFFKNFIGTLGSVLTPARLALGGLAAGVGAVAYAMYQGVAQSKDYADAIVLSGNFAGQTEGKFNAQVRAIAATGAVSAAAAREIGQALISTGQIGPQTFGVASEAAARYAEATKKSAKEVSEVFVGLAQDPAKAAAELNKTLNFLSAAQLAQIRTLQEGGKSADAQAIALEALNTRLKQLEPNLGILDRALRATKNTWAEFWDAAFDVGRAETIEQRIAKARQAVANGVGTERVSQTQLSPERRAQFARNSEQGAGPAEVAGENLRLLLRSQTAAEAIATNAAELAKLNKAAAGADEFVLSMDRRAKGAKGLERALAEANAEFKKQDDLAARDSNYKPSSVETRAGILKRIREDFTDKPAATQANDQRKAILDQDLKRLKDQLEQEQQALAFHEKYLQGVYNASAISLTDYYAEKRRVTEQGTAAELAALAAEQARIQQELSRGKFKDPAEKTRTETLLNESLERSAKVRRDASRTLVLADQEQAASTKALGDRIADYRAQLLQLAGDEAGAAAIRTQTAVANAKLFAQTTQGQPGAIGPEQVERFRVLTEQASEFAEVQRRLGVATADAGRAEEAYTLRAEKNGIGLLETERGIYTIRATSLVQLGELRDRAQELAAASTDPKIKAFAEDLALSYAKAADAVDPSIQRLKSGSDELAGSFSGLFGKSLTNAKNFRDEIDGLGKRMLEIATQTFITAPFEKAIKDAFRKEIDTDGVGIGNFLRGGVGAPAVQNADYSNEGRNYASLVSTLTTEQSTQATAIAASTTAVQSMTAAATLAAQALYKVAASQGIGSIGSALGGASGGGAGIDYNFGGAGFPMSDGTNYVPRDGFRAVLHKGESVTPAKYNPAAGGRAAGGGDVIQIVNNGQPATISRQEKSQMPDGRVLRKLVLEVMTSEVREGGQFDRAMGGTYGVSRRAPRRN